MKSVNRQPLIETLPVNRLFWRYALPSIGMMVVVSIYMVIDAIFIGQGVGDVALAAVTLCIPFWILFGSISMALSVGGGIVMGIYQGQKAATKANDLFTTLILLNMVIGLGTTAIIVWLDQSVALFLGADEHTLPYVLEYLRTLGWFMVFMTLNNLLQVVVKNDHNPNLALIATLVGSMINIPLDYWFIFQWQWGVAGAALATGLAQLIAVVILASHFLRQQGMVRLGRAGLTFGQMTRIGKNALPVFVGQLFPVNALYLMNMATLDVYGTIGVAAWAIISNLSTLVIFVLLGAAQGVQPIASYTYGAQDQIRLQAIIEASLKHIIGLGLALTVVLGALMPFWIDLFLSDNTAMHRFNQAELLALTQTGLWLYLTAFVFLGINVIVVSILQSIEAYVWALVITFVSSVLFLWINYWILPVWLSGTGVWLIIPVAEWLTLLLIVLIYRQAIRQWWRQR